MAALSRRKPALAGTSCDICRAQKHDNKDTVREDSFSIWQRTWASIINVQVVGKQSLFTVMVRGNAQVCTVRADCRVFSVKPGSADTVHCASYGYGSKIECAE
jgi:hypothetical protein